MRIGQRITWKNWTKLHNRPQLWIIKRADRVVKLDRLRVINNNRSWYLHSEGVKDAAATTNHSLDSLNFSGSCFAHDGEKFEPWMLGSFHALVQWALDHDDDNKLVAYFGGYL